MVEVTADGELIALRSGTAVVRVAIGKVRSEVPVTVRGGETFRPVDFTNDINPLLTRLGCNGGSCHGKSNGRGGFRLSLFGPSSRVGLRVDHTGRPRPTDLLGSSGPVPVAAEADHADASRWRSPNVG
ncbi:MAG: hypothetical protein Ct9H300mP1_08650 [Planctomycetaceae bacterium]|nr:MAG: hypothetical protein Ct9H300mP1_08650 [Planctomycetaceae bacterium]